MVSVDRILMYWQAAERYTKGLCALPTIKRYPRTIAGKPQETKPVALAKSVIGNSFAVKFP